MRFWTSNRASIGDYRVSWVLKIAPQRHDGRSVDTAPLRLEPMTSHEPSAICSRRGPIRVMGGLVEDRKWPMAAMLAMLIAGVGYMLLWNPWVHHVDSWNTGGDLWGIFRGAHYVGWGFIGGVYTPQNGIITFPGMPILMAPLAIVSGWLHLSESYGAFTLPRPTAALLIQPFELLLASTAVFACDNLARRLLVTSRRRIALCRGNGKYCLAHGGHLGPRRGRRGHRTRRVGVGRHSRRQVETRRLVARGWHPRAAPGGLAGSLAHRCHASRAALDGRPAVRSPLSAPGRCGLRRRPWRHVSGARQAADPTGDQSRHAVARLGAVATVCARSCRGGRPRTRPGPPGAHAHHRRRSDRSVRSRWPGPDDRRGTCHPDRSVCVATATAGDNGALAGRRGAGLALLLRTGDDSLLPGTTALGRPGVGGVGIRPTVLGCGGDRWRAEHLRLFPSGGLGLVATDGRRVDRSGDAGPTQAMPKLAWPGTRGTRRALSAARPVARHARQWCDGTPGGRRRNGSEPAVDPGPRRRDGIGVAGVRGASRSGRRPVDRWSR